MLSENFLKDADLFCAGFKASHAVFKEIINCRNSPQAPRGRIATVWRALGARYHLFDLLTRSRIAATAHPAVIYCTVLCPLSGRRQRPLAAHLQKQRKEISVAVAGAPEAALGESGCCVLWCSKKCMHGVLARGLCCEYTAMKARTGEQPGLPAWGVASEGSAGLNWVHAACHFLGSIAMQE